MKALWTRLAILALLVVTITVLVWPKTRREVVVTPPVSSPAPRAAGATLPEDLLSDISVDLEINQAAVQSAMDTLIPRDMSGTEDDPLAAANNDRLTWSIDIGSAELSSANGALGFRIPLQNGKVNITGRVGVAKSDTRGLGWLTKALGVDFDETVEFNGAIVGTLKPRINDEWNIEPELNWSVSLSKADAEFFGSALKVSLRGAIIARIEATMREQERKMRTRLASDGRIATAVERVWNAMYSVVQLSPDPVMWLSWEPVALLVSSFEADDNTVSITLGTRVRTRVVVSPQRPVLELRPLPPPDTVAKGRDIAMNVPVSIPLDEVPGVAPDELGLSRILEFADASVHFDALQISELTDTLTVGVTVSVQQRWRPTVTTTLFVTGNASLDPVTNRLALTDARFDENTLEALPDISEVLLRTPVLGAIEQRSVFQVLEPEQELLTRTSGELDMIETALPDWMTADLNISRGRVQGISTNDGWLVAVLAIVGRASVRVEDINALLEGEAL